MQRLFAILPFVILQACADNPGSKSPSDADAGRGGQAGSAGSAVAGSGTSGGSSGVGPGGTGSGGSNGGALTTGGTGNAGGSASGGSAGVTGGAGSGGAAGGEIGGTAGTGGSSAGTGGSSAGTAGSGAGTGGAGGAAATRFVGTWSAGPQLTETANNPPAPGLSGNTLRQVVFTSIGGSRMRVLLSNTFGNGPVTMTSVHVAVSTTGSAINASSDRALTFGGMPQTTIPAGQTVWSDPLDMTVSPLTKLAVSIAFGAVPSGITGHPGSRTTSYIMTGNAVSTASPTPAASTEHWYYLTAIDVTAPSSAAAVVTLGDSITDGRGSTTDANNRWPDAFSRRLRANGATANVGVLNQGIGGNAVVSGGLGPTAVARFDRDVLGQSGVRWVIVLEGVNDIGGATGTAVATNLINAFQQFVTKARAAGVRAYGVPILPFGGSSYASADHETARQTVNTWIRANGNFDAVIDLDAAVRDPANPANLLAAYDSGDHLHLSPAGYQKMADAIELALFNQ